MNTSFWKNAHVRLRPPGLPVPSLGVSPVLPFGYHDLLCVRSLWVGGGCCPHGQSAIHATGVLLAHCLTEAWRSLSSSSVLWLPSDTHHSHMVPANSREPSSGAFPPSWWRGGLDVERLGMSTTVCHFLCLWFLVLISVVGNYKVGIFCTLKSW